MITVIIIGLIFLLISLLCLVLKLVFKLTGALVSLAFWIFVKLPVGVLLVVLGIVLCCTLLLIPIGKRVFQSGIKMIF